MLTLIRSGCLLICAAMTSALSAEDVYVTYRMEDLRHLANTASVMEQMTEAETTEYLGLCDKMLVKKKEGGSLEGGDEKRLYALTVKAVGSIEKAELEV